MNPPVGVEHSPLAVAVIVRWGIACLIASTSVGSVPSGNGTTMLPSKMVSMFTPLPGKRPAKRDRGLRIRVALSFIFELKAEYKA
jgi:hypothetical protein